MFEFLKSLFAEPVVEMVEEKFKKTIIPRSGMLDLEINAKLLGGDSWNCGQAGMQLFELKNGNYLIFKTKRSYNVDENDNEYVHYHKICKSVLEILECLEYSDRVKKIIYKCGLEITEKLED